MKEKKKERDKEKTHTQRQKNRDWAQVRAVRSMDIKDELSVVKILRA